MPEGLSSEEVSEIVVAHIKRAKELSKEGEKPEARRVALAGVEICDRGISLHGMPLRKEMTILWGIASFAGAPGEDAFEEYFKKLGEEEQEEVREFLENLGK